MPRNLRYAAFVEEDSYGIDNPTGKDVEFHVDKTSSSLDTPSDTEMIYGGGFRRDPYLHAPGFYAPTGNVAFAANIKTLTFFLRWALGDYNYEENYGENGMDLHECWGSESVKLPSFITKLGKDKFEHVFNGCVLNSLQLQVEGEFLVVTADIVAKKDHHDDIKEDNYSFYEDIPLLTFHHTSVEITDMRNGNSVESDEIKNLTLEINNNVSADDGRALGDRHPVRLLAGEREVTADMNLFYDDVKVVREFWGADDGPSLAGTGEFKVEITISHHDDNENENANATITLPKCIFTSVDVQPSGRDKLEPSVTARAFTEEDYDGLEKGNVTTAIATQIEVDGLGDLEGKKVSE